MHDHSGTVSRIRVAQIAVVFLYLIVYVAPLSIRPLSSPDEVRYGAIAHEMLTSGDWVSPTFNGVRYFEKPALGHWLNAASFAAFGENAFALRFPSALATGLTALILFFLSRRFASTAAATLTAAIYLTTLLVGGVGTLAILDSFLTLFTTAALAAWYFALEETRSLPRLRYLVYCGAACAGAFLAKGFLGWLIPALVAGGHLCARRQWRAFATLAWVPVGVALLSAAPWAILVHLREPDFWHYFFWVEHIKRFAAEDAQHARPPWFYVVYLPLMAWPWILSWPTALRGLFARMRQDSFVLYLVLWFALPFIFFSITRGKMLTYVLPCFPALSILLAIGLERLVAQAERTPLRAAVISLAVIQALGLAGILAAQAGAFGFPPYAEAELLKVGALCTLLTSSVAVSAFAARAARTDVRIAAISIGAAVLLLLFQIAIPQRALDVAAPVSALTNYTPSRDAVLISDAQRFGTIAWAFKRDDVYVVSAGEIAYGLSYPEERYRELDGTMLRELIATSHPNHDIVIICKSETAREIMPDLPPAMTRTVHGSTVVLELARAK